MLQISSYLCLQCPYSLCGKRVLTLLGYLLLFSGNRIENFLFATFVVRIDILELLFVTRYRGVESLELDYRSLGTLRLDRLGL